MDTIKRYELVNVYSENEGRYIRAMRPDPDGTWVKFVPPKEPCERCGGQIFKNDVCVLCGVDWS